MSLCDPSKRVLVVGEVFIDRHVDHSLLRLGGIFHIARTFHALRTAYAAAYICPEYVDSSCRRFFSDLACSDFRKIGNVTGAPNIMEVGHSEEAGDQEYQDILRSEREVALDILAFGKLVDDFRPTDLLILGGFDWRLMQQVFASVPRMHIDLDHDVLGSIDGAPYATTFYSTSGEPFKRAGRSPARLREVAQRSSSTVLKENRGGSRLWSSDLSRDEVEAPAYPSVTRHSVGAGDCFDAMWVAAHEDTPPKLRLRAASYLASLYVSTFSHDEFVQDVRAAENLWPEIQEFVGTRLSWEERQNINIYVAAPDFPHIGTDSLEELEAAILYHNFKPRLPIRENGLGHSDMKAADRRALYDKDIRLLHECQLLLAVPLVDDPGTFAELGWFAGANRPTILYDADKRISNLFAVNVATRVCTTRSGVIDSVFELLGRRMS